jgi:hypothetical protein
MSAEPKQKGHFESILSFLTPQLERTPAEPPASEHPNHPHETPNKRT